MDLLALLDNGHLTENGDFHVCARHQGERVRVIFPKQSQFSNLYAKLKANITHACQEQGFDPDPGFVVARMRTNGTQTPLGLVIQSWSLATWKGYVTGRVS